MTRQQCVDFVTKYNIPLRNKIGNMLLTEIKTTIKEWMVSYKKDKEQVRRLAIPMKRSTSLVAVSDHIFFTDIDEKTVVEVEVRKEWLEITASIVRVIPVPDMEIPASIILHQNHLIYSDISEHGGIFRVWLESGKGERILDTADHHPHGLAQWNATLLFTNPQSSSEMFAG